MKIANILFQTFIIFLLRNNHSHSRAWGACAEHYHNVAEDLKINYVCLLIPGLTDNNGELVTRPFKENYLQALDVQDD